MKIKITAVIEVDEKCKDLKQLDIKTKESVLRYYQDAIGIWLNEDNHVIESEILETEAIEVITSDKDDRKDFDEEIRRMLDMAESYYRVGDIADALKWSRPLVMAMLGQYRDKLSDEAKQELFTEEGILL